MDTLGRPQANSVIERANRLVLEWARAPLTYVGLGKRWWLRAVRCFCFAYNSSREVLDGPSPFERHHSYHFAGKTIPFGALVSYVLAIHEEGHASRGQVRAADEEGSSPGTSCTRADYGQQTVSLSTWRSSRHHRTVVSHRPFASR